MPETLASCDNRKSAIENQKSPPSLYLLRQQIIHDLAAALASASRHLSLHLAGQSDLSEPAHLQTALATLKYLPHLIDLLPTEEPDPDTEPPNPLLQKLIAQHIYDRKNHNLTPDQVPRCPICLQGPGAHWADACPQRQPRHDIIRIIEVQNSGRI